METMRESWTDERLDYLNHRIDDGFKHVDERFQQVDDRMIERFKLVDERFDRLDVDNRDFQTEMRNRLDGLHRIMLQFSGLMIAALIGLIATQL